ncbi:hypothetical protein BOTBODRAFT_255230 [Botryobasidium botryosum FD-172 SS1]|uniref:Fungal-type protein kinase domain-containing protein n=1 Tax=Botryobasidium botryosum (strain FD-172 SS1) TaxID=930990 RepID=A0A067M3B4_BOTB1|nr:hypothetical protein BOTBODRAFT_255230 [Botryobasidium botryosum FD-172 SS1]
MRRDHGCRGSLLHRGGKTISDSLAKIIIGLALSGPDALGFDPRFSPPEGCDFFIPSALEGWRFSVDDTTFVTIEETVYVQWCPFGRGTAVYKVAAARGEKRILKTGHPYACAPAEYSLLDKARAALGEGVPVIYGYSSGGLVSAGIRKILAPHAPVAIERDRRMQILLMEILLPLNKLTGSEYLNAWVDIVEDLARLRKQNMLHRDISSANLMYRRTGTKIRGVLNDFDLALDLDNLASYPAHLLRPTGTTPFLARELIEDTRDIPHLLRHDIESAIYVLIWDAVRSAIDETGRTTHEYLRDWLLPDRGWVAKVHLQTYLMARCAYKLPLGCMEPIRKSIFRVVTSLLVGYNRMDSWLDELGKCEERACLDGEQKEHYESMCAEFDAQDVVRRLGLMRQHFESGQPHPAATF